MLIEQIEIEGFGPYLTPQKVKLEADLVGIYGRNGMGKTFLLEGPFAVFYGSFPSRRGTIYDQVNDTLQNGKISVKFSLNGENYRAERTVDKKGKKQICNLYRNGKKVAGPKAKEYAEAVRTLLGTEETVLASTFSSADNSGDLTLLPGSMRKQLLAEWLGLEHYQILSDAAKQKIKSIESELAQIRVRLDIVTQTAQERENIRLLIENLNREINAIRTEISEWERKKSKIDAEIAALKEKKKNLSHLNERKNSIESELLSLREKYKSLSQDRKNILLLIKEKPSLLSAKREHQEVSKKIEELEKKINAVLETREKAQKAKDKLVDRLHRVKNEITHLRTRLAQAEKESKTIDIVNCDRRDCPFLKNAWEARDTIPLLTKKLNSQRYLAEELQKKINAVKVPEPPGKPSIRHRDSKKKERNLNLKC